MKLCISQIRPNNSLGSGGVVRYELPEENLRVTQITVFCPDGIGPGGTHVYLVEKEALLMFDTGLPTDAAKALFFPRGFRSIPSHIKALPDNYSEKELLEGIKLSGYSVDDIDALVISHGHPDHFMMGRTIIDRSNARVAAHILDTSTICNPWSPISRWLCGQAAAKAMGMPPSLPNRCTVEQAVKEAFCDWDNQRLFYAVSDPVFENGPLSLNGDQLPGIQAVHLPGHSPGSIGLELGKGIRMLLCGDTLLSTITPIPDDLLEYLRTLETLKDQEGSMLALPGHGERICSLSARAAEIQCHHRKRLEKCYRACAERKSVWEIATVKDMFDIPVDPHEFNLLAGKEVLSHLELLILADGVRRCDIVDGVEYFINSEEPFEAVYSRIGELVGDKDVGWVMRH